MEFGLLGNLYSAISSNFVSRSILLDSNELTDSMNNKFIMKMESKWLRNLLLMLDLALVECVNHLVKDYRKSYVQLRSHLMSIRRVRNPL